MPRGAPSSTASASASRAPAQTRCAVPRESRRNRLNSPSDVTLLVAFALACGAFVHWLGATSDHGRRHLRGELCRRIRDEPAF
jgi:hypothetical protein